ncbi:MAG: HRDC domain-containing protein [Actinobacteria bacterium]|nr:HRDC domain-containing protein [Myxococcales bacterium]MCB0872874.1 HRDC domain-containing protein [Thermoleophilia bacterium]MCB9011825.1 HRDC domain-containing protein [Actinomycetota bacterium]
MDAAHPPIITEAAGVSALVERVRDAGQLAIDFEFLWERTYAPLPCLAQVACEGRIDLVDPIAGAPLEPLAALVADPEILTIMHAPSADLTLLGMQFDELPANLLDVQLIAGFVGLGAGQGLSTLLARVLDVRLDKGEQYTDWRRRPLSDKQIEYARADVAYLDALVTTLLEQAGALGRADWVAEEHERRYGPGQRWVPDPDESWRKVKGQGKLSARDRSVLQCLARWREIRAQERDRPAAWLLPDRTLIEIARRKPTSADRLLRERGVPERMPRDDIEAILAAVAEGRDAEPVKLPAPVSSEYQGRLETLVGLGQILVAGRAATEGLAPSLLATRDEVESFLADAIGARSVPDSPLATGWRFAFAGAPLRDLAEGRIALAAGSTPPYLREIARAPE